MKLFLYAASWVALCCCVNTTAQSTPQHTRVSVIGNKRIPQATILNHAQLSNTFGPQEHDEALKRLLATGLFKDVRISSSGRTLLINIEEKPVIRRVTFHVAHLLDANDPQQVLQERETYEQSPKKLPLAFDMSALQQQFSLQPGNPYSPTEAKKDADRIQANLIATGYPHAHVTAATYNPQKGAVDVAFTIDLGESAVLEGVFFRGNNFFEAARLSSILASTAYSPQTAFWGLLTHADIYSPERIAWDMKMLENFYLNNGFLDFFIESHVVEFIPERQGFFLTFTLNEGKRYTVKGVDISEGLSGLNLDSVKENANETLVNEVYSKEKIEKIIRDLESLLEESGLPQFTVGVRLNKESSGLCIILELVPQKVYEIRHIKLKGHRDVSENYIRRLLPYAEGDIFTRQRLSEGYSNLEYVDLFKNVAIKVVDTASDNQKDILVDLTVNEGLTTLFFDIGGVYESHGRKGFHGAAHLKFQNFLDQGHTLYFSGGKSSLDRWIWNIAFERQFQPKGWGVNGKVFYDIQESHVPLTQQERQQERFKHQRSRHAYNDTAKGFEVGVSYNFNRQLSHGFEYRLAHEVFDVKNTEAKVYANMKDKQDLKSSLGYFINYDQRNRRNNPSQGYRVRGDIAYSGFPGTIHLIEGSLRGSLHIPISYDHRFHIHLESHGSSILSLNKSGSVRIKDRFFLGGQSLRGFEPKGIGPRDSEKSALGGHHLIHGRAEIISPLTSGHDSVLQGVLFADVGCVWGLAASDVDKGVDSQFSLRSSVGLGVRVRIPGLAKFFIGWGFPMIYRKGVDRCFPLVIELSN